MEWWYYLGMEFLKVLGKHPAEQLIHETAKLVPTSLVQLFEFGENGSFGSLRTHVFKEPQIAENFDLYYFKEQDRLCQNTK